jgi:dTDP-4-dehydrorhamnose 3,5-epimerase
MIFKETKLKGSFIIEIERLEDQRGFFARGWCKMEFESHGLESRLVQANISLTKKKGTLRGLHYQVAPHEETKIIRCTRGSVYDVVVDLRPNSPTYMQWLGVELSADNYRMLYVPRGFARGYQTLEDKTEIFYHVSEFYTPAAERGIRYDDPVFGISWPLRVEEMSDKDKSWPDYKS